MGCGRKVIPDLSRQCNAKGTFSKKKLFMQIDAIFLLIGVVLIKKSEMNALCKTLCDFWDSSIGKKLIVAVTGIMLVGFLIAHMAGNLLIFQGRESLNDYAYFLHHFLHGMGIWLFRVGLIVAFVLHIVATVSLTRQNRAARSEKYAHEATSRASLSSRYMIWSGLTVIAFVIFHLLHFTVRIDPDLASMKDPMDPSRHDAYGMVIAGFQNPVVVLFYIISISFLCSHLSHGIASIFQTLGFNSKKTRDPFHKLGLVISVVLWLGFLSIPFLALFDLIGDGEKDAPVPMEASVNTELLFRC
jgi:succinate dehydrogenase / fumarate reductase cytochrome b subunit